ncbi:MAG: peptidoglycan DD-metalloendopeptidase family protein [Deltaproteobacteria bacterium]|jgi:murein DD-endopeptidase MepM/ murein hydrolase activator NlpD|nr:peptidoglycan DD-metalloendopeptidase family protein [Deltaproteobacteria bacterium]
MAKRYRICVLTEGDGPVKIRGFTLSAWFPKFTLWLLTFIILALCVYAGYAHKQLSHIEDRSLELQILQSAKVASDLQLAAVTERLHGLEWQMGELAKRERDLSLLTREFNIQLGLPEGSELASVWPELVNTVAWTWGATADQGGVDAAPFHDNSPMEALRGMHRDLDRLEESAAATELALSELSAALLGSKELLSVTPYSNPVPAGRVSSTFGYRSSPFGGRLDFHRGLDLAAPVGTPVYAPADGTVLSSDWSKSGYGLMITIDHGYGLSTRYAHLSEALVTVGQKVTRGEMIAKVGSTGRSTGPHLHYETLLGEVNVDPQSFIQAKLDYKTADLDPKNQK